jgi:hypothetical protein
MIRIIAMCVAAASLAACSGGGNGAEGGTLVTVHGAIETVNRDRMDNTMEPLFRAYGLDFDTGYGLNAGALGDLDQRSVRVAFPEGGERHVFTGPLVRDVVALADPQGGTITVTALDGYQRDIALDRVMEHDVILATHMDGQTLHLGGFGPAMLVWPRDTDDALAGMDDSDWVWGIFSIEVSE